MVRLHADDKKITQIKKYLERDWSGLWVNRDSRLRTQMCPILDPDKNAQFFLHSCVSRLRMYTCSQLLAYFLTGSPCTLVPSFHSWAATRNFHTKKEIFGTIRKSFSMMTKKSQNHLQNRLPLNVNTNIGRFDDLENYCPILVFRAENYT